MAVSRADIQRVNQGLNRWCDVSIRWLPGRAPLAARRAAMSDWDSR
jgi:hypothetical protein